MASVTPRQSGILYCHAVESGTGFLTGTGFQSWNLDYPKDFSFLELNARFQSPRSPIPEAKISKMVKSGSPYNKNWLEGVT